MKVTFEKFDVVTYVRYTASGDWLPSAFLWVPSDEDSQGDFHNAD
jgi:hypothetical protein